MNRIILSMIIIGFLVNVGFTNELNHQNKDKIVNKNNTENRDNLISNKHISKVKVPDSKNGFFVGIEGVLGTSKGDLTLDFRNLTPEKKDPFPLFFSAKAKTTLDLGFLWGYQHYFGDSLKHGIKVSLHTYSGFGNSWQNKHSLNDKGGIYKSTSIISYIPMKFGADIKYVWDFLEIGKHTLGVNLGVGYEFDFYLNGKEAMSLNCSESDSGCNLSEKFFNDRTRHIDSMFSNHFYPVIGMHYYYKQHQFELMYRFGGIIPQTGNNIIKTVTKEGILVGDLVMSVKLINQSYFTMNYSYRY
ncbi:hypothetical protein BKH42_02990 [Helicobacter sp. 13S00482-2]|uniref:hypothetical protein n=1 Tax=Helicobacter sp. 13S00482-2 TaxID=1476200 RepID=UPI000BA578EC|nr:hypothetical protein [Helicobacter sp. 13S00482-2]PAF53949.1 hypothetical protein BKH42_02990 [Helicobacter sp. 13S00482-2]